MWKISPDCAATVKEKDVLMSGELETTWEEPEDAGNCSSLAAVLILSFHCMMSLYGIPMEDHDKL